MIIDTIGTWGIGIPLCLLAAFGLHWGIVGVYALLTTEEIFRLAVSLVIFKKLDDQPVTGNFSVHICSQSRVLTPKTTVQLVLFSAWSSPQYQPLSIILSL